MLEFLSDKKQEILEPKHFNIFVSVPLNCFFGAETIGFNLYFLPTFLTLTCHLKRY